MLLTTDQALAIAERRQRAALADAAHFGAAMGSPLRFICRPTPDGPEFEAVLMDESRSCAIVTPDGELSWLTERRTRDPWADRAPRSSKRFVRRPASAPALGQARPVTVAPPEAAPAPEPRPAPDSRARPVVSEPPPPVAPRPCAKRSRRVQVPLGRRQAVVRLAWGPCERDCCREAAPPLVSVDLTPR